MSVSKAKGLIFDSGLCRCCGSMKKCRLLNVEYEYMGVKEIYSDMMMDCFGLLISHLDGEPTERLVCATCVTRLREAYSFRQQVLRCEEAFLQVRMCDGESQKHNATDSSSLVEIKLVKQELCNNSRPGSRTSPACDALADNEHNATDSLNLMEVELVKQELCEDSQPGSQTSSACDALADNDSDYNSEVAPRLTRSLARKLKELERQRETRTETSISEGEATRDLMTRTQKISKRMKKAKDAGVPKRSTTNTKKKSDNDMMAHQNIISIVENSYVCPFDSTFSNYYCIYCRQQFTDPNNLREHTLTHDPQKYKELTYRKPVQIDILRIDCRLCPQRIDNIDDLKRHITSIHKKVIYPKIQNEFLKYRLTLGRLTCTECNNSFTYFHALKKHMAEHFGTCVCYICGTHFFQERMLLMHQKTHQRINYPCEECGKMFKSKHNRYLHIARTHKKEPAFPCAKCDEVLFSYTLRYRHMIEVHGDQRLFECDQCDRTYDTRKSLLDHNRRFHLKIFKHQCNLCDKRFYLPSMLREHMATHSGERNFHCEYCGKSYPRLRGLKAHMQSHSSEKKYKCDLCYASFTKNVNLRNHMTRQHQSLEEGYYLF